MKATNPKKEFNHSIKQISALKKNLKKAEKRITKLEQSKEKDIDHRIQFTSLGRRISKLEDYNAPRDMGSGKNSSDSNNKQIMYYPGTGIPVAYKLPLNKGYLDTQSFIVQDVAYLLNNGEFPDNACIYDNIHYIKGESIDIDDMELNGMELEGLVFMVISSDECPPGNTIECRSEKAQSMVNVKFIDISWIMQTYESRTVYILGNDLGIRTIGALAPVIPPYFKEVLNGADGVIEEIVSNEASTVNDMKASTTPLDMIKDILPIQTITPQLEKILEKIAADISASNDSDNSVDCKEDTDIPIQKVSSHLEKILTILNSKEYKESDMHIDLDNNPNTLTAEKLRKMELPEFPKPRIDLFIPRMECPKTTLDAKSSEENKDKESMEPIDPQVLAAIDFITSSDKNPYPNIVGKGIPYAEGKIKLDIEDNDIDEILIFLELLNIRCEMKQEMKDINDKFKESKKEFVNDCKNVINGECRKNMVTGGYPRKIRADKPICNHQMPRISETPPMDIGTIDHLLKMAQDVAQATFGTDVYMEKLHEIVSNIYNMSKPTTIEDTKRGEINLIYSVTGSGLVYIPKAPDGYKGSSMYILEVDDELLEKLRKVIRVNIPNIKESSDDKPQSEGLAAIIERVVSNIKAPESKESDISKLEDMTLEEVTNHIMKEVNRINIAIGQKSSHGDIK